MKQNLIGLEFIKNNRKYGKDKKNVGCYIGEFSCCSCEVEASTKAATLDFSRLLHRVNNDAALHHVIAQHHDIETLIANVTKYV